MTEAIKALDFLANKFVEGEWVYSRENDIKHIRYEGDNKGYDRLDKRIRRTLRQLWHAVPIAPADGLTKTFGWKRSWKTFPMKAVAIVQVGLGLDSHRPDGVLSNGIITHWEEHGEYIMLMQPSVANLLIDFIKDDPDHPSAKAISNELNRIWRNYTSSVD